MADFNPIETNAAKIYDDIIGNLMECCGEALYPGDERRIFAEGLVQVFVSLFPMFNDRAQQYVFSNARGTVLDGIGDMLRVTRLAPAPASATFRFTTAAALPQNIVIPAGTRITADGTVYFATVEAAVIHSGATSVQVEASCTEGGAAHNGYAFNTITTLVDLIPYIAGVTNITATTGGDDGEPYTEDGDNRYRERIRLSPASMSPGTEAGYTYYAKSADPDIVDVRVDCPSDQPNTVNIYALMSGGALPDSDTLQKIMDTIEAGNVRIMTDHVQAFAPGVLDYSINIRYSCPADRQAEVIQAVEGEGGAIAQYVAWQSAKMGRAIMPDKLQHLLYQAGATMVTVNSPYFGNVPKNMVARLSSEPTIEQTVVEIE